MMVYTLTLNPAFDIYYMCSSFQTGKDNRAVNKRVVAGGKGINVSRVLKKNGIENRAAVICGAENFPDFKKALNGEADIIPFMCDGRIRKNITICAEDSGETRLCESGELEAEKAFRLLSEMLLNEAKIGDIAVLSGSIPKSIKRSEAVEVLKKLKANGIRIACDTTAFGMNELVDIKPWLIKPNASELAALDIKAATTPETAARLLHEAGIENVLITLGGDGAVCCYENGKTECISAPVVKPVSTVGAGDSCVAGFISGYIMGTSPIETAMRYAAIQISGQANIK